MRWRGCAATSRIRCSCPHRAGCTRRGWRAASLPVRCRCCANSKPSCSAANHSTRHRSRLHWRLSPIGLGENSCSCPGWRTACAARHRVAACPTCRCRPTGWPPRWKRWTPTGDRHSQSAAPRRGQRACSASTSWRSARRTGNRAAGVPAACSARASWQRRRWWWPTPATTHNGVTQMLARLQISDSAMLQVRHYAAMIDLVCDSDLVAIVPPQMYAQTLATGRAVRVWELPGHGPHYEVRMVWHRSASADPAHAGCAIACASSYARPCAAAEAEAQLRSASYWPAVPRAIRRSRGAARCSRPGTPACTAARPRRLRIRCSAAGRSRRSGRRR